MKFLSHNSNREWNYLPDNQPDQFEGRKLFDCLVVIGSIAPITVNKQTHLKMRNGRIVENLQDWQYVIAWREL